MDEARLFLVVHSNRARSNGLKCEYKKFFCMLVQNFLCSSFRPLLFVLSLHTTDKSLASSICLPLPFVVFF